MAISVSQSSSDSARTEFTLPIDIPRHQFSVQQYHEMIEHGILDENESVELIRGEIVKKMPVGNLHAATVKRINRLFASLLPTEALLSIQDPISTADSEPEPDVAVLNFREHLYAVCRPVAQDVRLSIEVADSSINYDRDIKGAVYASAGISEYWIINLNNNTIEVYHNPQPDGRFATVTTAQVGEILRPKGLAGISLKVDELLGIS